MRELSEQEEWLYRIISCMTMHGCPDYNAIVCDSEGRRLGTRDDHRLQHTVLPHTLLITSVPLKVLVSGPFFRHVLVSRAIGPRFPVFNDRHNPTSSRDDLQSAMLLRKRGGLTLGSLGQGFGSLSPYTIFTCIPQGRPTKPDICENKPW